MSRRPSRVTMAALLTFAVVVVPCAAWWMVGSRSAASDAARIEEAPRLEALQSAVALAERLGARLTGIRETESRRPSYHYKHQYHDPRSNCECASVTPSPLAGGSIDPLVWTHFQIDSRQVSLPTLAPDAPTDAGPWFRTQDDLRHVLQENVASLLAMADPSPHAAMRVQGTRLPWPTQLVDETPPPLRWASLPLGDQPVLAATRVLPGYAGAVIQGFLLSPEALAAFLSGSTFPATAGPSHDRDAIMAPLALSGVEWFVTVDARAAEAEAALRARGVRTRFARIFAGGSTAALLAGLLLVGLVWQTERLSRAREQFATSAAHELRTPLAGLRLYAEMLAEDLGDPARVKDYARRVADEADRLGRVVTNVLGYAQLERGRVDLALKTGDLGAVVGECVERLRPALEASGARLELDSPPQLAPVAFDGEAIAHIVGNLVDNAEKYSRAATDRTISVALEDRGERVALSVRDRGPGIPEAMRARLFRPFVRGSDGDGPAGLGLGLTLVETLARGHGAQVDYGDAPGGGARFTVAFPTVPA